MTLDPYPVQRRRYRFCGWYERLDRERPPVSHREVDDLVWVQPVDPRTGEEILGLFPRLISTVFLPATGEQKSAMLACWFEPEGAELPLVEWDIEVAAVTTEAAIP